jgi:alanyl-tRNA synthetase
VIRRILRRLSGIITVFLEIQSPVLFELVPILASEFGDVFPEINQQQSFVAKVIEEEEKGFLRTLADGILRFESYCNPLSGRKSPADLNKTITIPSVVDGKFAFELYDTYGFPIDLTQLLASEKICLLTWPVRK